MSLNLVAVVELPDPEAGRRYEDSVLTLLRRHGGRLERRLRTTDDRSEVQLLWFPSQQAYEFFLGDPDRLALRAELGDAVPTVRVLEVRDV